MSVRVLTEVFEKSRARGIDRLVLLALADGAHHDGVTWLPVEAAAPKRGIVQAANCSRAEAFRAIKVLRDELGELEVVKVRRRSSFVNVYRVTVGRIVEVPVDYSRLPFELPHQFGQGLTLRRSAGDGAGAAPAARPSDGLAGSGSQVETVTGTVSPSQREGVQGLNGEGFTVSSCDSSPLYRDFDPLEDPSRIQKPDPSHPSPGAAEDLLADPRLTAQLLPFVERFAGEADRVEIGSRLAAIDRDLDRPSRQALLGRVDELRGETAAQAYSRWIDEKAAERDFPLEEIAAVVATWDELDDVERQELVDRAERLRVTPAHARTEAA